MKLVLLPGMNGTGQLFQDVLAELGDVDTLVVSLPQQGPQDYRTLSRHVSGLLPDDDYVILAESFSGGIAAQFSRNTNSHLQGIIFVASFLSSPAPVLAVLAKFLPLRILLSLPFSSFMIRAFLLGRKASDDLFARFRNAILSVSLATLRSRLSIIARTRYDGFNSTVPAVYIGAGRDVLVGRDKRQEFAAAYADIVFAEIDAPHFLLQSKPGEAAAIIREAMHHFEKHTEAQSGKR